jgi:hypothetical protein
MRALLSQLATGGRSSVKRLCPEGDVSLGEQNAGTELKHHKIRIKVSYTSIMCWDQTSQLDPVAIGLKTGHKHADDHH